MGRGLSQLQHDILGVLPAWVDREEDRRADEMPSTREVVKALGLPFTPSHRAAVSRAISRLQARHRVGSVWGYKHGRQHNGYARFSEEQAKALEAAAAEALMATRRAYCMAHPFHIPPVSWGL